ncbi:hypothetical protein CSKR_202249 [Clonorchis sinensis]|uniref:Uncharacterized protein n=1 Tax=Clonorchis sinensis TaxID=79923 RepID=A0A8T1LYP4_CLOSI|nr:hypothetical protein CSKR_202249 [Clonorchis sinensis]
MVLPPYASSPPNTLDFSSCGERRHDIPGTITKQNVSVKERPCGKNGSFSEPSYFVTKHDLRFALVDYDVPPQDLMWPKEAFYDNRVTNSAGTPD